MAPARHTKHVRRPVEDVFAVLTNVKLTGRWYPAQVEEWWTSAPPHGRGLGNLKRMMESGEL